MASGKNVIVLTPNGRRQNIKVTPNTTILQILEEACKKQGFNPQEYDLKHHNHVLDASNNIRFSGLPNNALLEMCTLQKPRSEEPVTLGLQLEDGQRLMGSFSPGDNLLTVLKKLCPEKANPEENPVVIYMRQEVYGIQALENTLLRQLGITGGRAMLRLLNRTPEELQTQANVSVPLPSKPTEEKPYIRKLIRSESPPGKAGEASSVPKKPPNSANPDSTQHTCSAKKDATAAKNKENFLTQFIKRERSKQDPSAPAASKSTANNKDQEPMEVDPVSSTSLNISEESKVSTALQEFTFLGERNALAFSLEMAATVPHEDLPDEFFELTIQDARKLLNDLKKKRMELEERPLETTAMKKLEEDKKTLRNLNQYKKSIIRVQFPDRTVLQGVFKPLETIEVVMNFVKEYLQEPNNQFHLYTTPPKSVLPSNKTLLDTDCVPSAVVHFAFEQPVNEDYKYLKPELFEKFITPSLASIAASKSRRETFKMSDINAGASTSKSGNTSKPIVNGQVPKRLKPNN